MARPASRPLLLPPTSHRAPTLAARLSSAAGVVVATGTLGSNMDQTGSALDKHAQVEGDAQVEDEAQVEEYEWQTTGHEFLGRFVAREFGRKVAIGNISKWLPPDGDDGALFHVSHLDGDEEDLDQEEAEEAFERYQTTSHCREAAKRKEDATAHLLGPLALSAHRLLQLHPHCGSLAQCDTATQAVARQVVERATAALRALNETLEATLGVEVGALEAEDPTKTKPEGQAKDTASSAAVPSASTTGSAPPPVPHGQDGLAAPEVKGGSAHAQKHRRSKHSEPQAQKLTPGPGKVGADVGVGSRVQDSEGICGEIVARSGAWLTMRTDAGEERKMRKADLELITPGAPAVAPISAGDAGGAQAAASDRKQGARGASQKARKRGRAAVESTNESASPSDQSEAGELLTSRS